jgi:hypothetical protein
MRQYVAAASAIEIDSPHDQGHRVTFGAASVSGEMALGLGYAYRFNDQVDAPVLKLGIGRSSDDTVVKGALSMEF